MRIHTGEYLFYCDFCQKPFRQKYNLLRHFRKHFKTMPLNRMEVECPECSKTLASRYSLIRHLGKFHADFVEETRQEAMKIERNLLSVKSWIKLVFCLNVSRIFRFGSRSKKPKHSRTVVLLFYKVSKWMEWTVKYKISTKKIDCNSKTSKIHSYFLNRSVLFNFDIQ